MDIFKNTFFCEFLIRNISFIFTYTSHFQDSSSYLEKSNKNNVPLGKETGVILWELLVKKFRKLCVLILLLVFLDVCIVRVIQFVFLRRLIALCRKQNTEGYGCFYYATMLTIASLGHILLQNMFMHQINKLRIQIRMTVSSMVYNKTLRVATYVMGSFSTGNLLNLISSDLNCLSGLAVIFRAILSPIYVITLGIMLWNEIGCYAIFAVAILIISLPLQLKIICRLIQTEKKVTLARDKRISKLAETLGSLKLIKVQVWEQFFKKRIIDSRTSEEYHLKSKAGWETLQELAGMLVEKLVLHLTLLAWIVLFESKIKIHFTVALVERIVSCLTSEIPPAAKEFGDICSTFARIEEYLNQPDKVGTQYSTLENINNNLYDLSSDPCILVETVTARWRPYDDPVLHSISTSIFGSDHLTVITGKSGSGKSALLKTLLNEIIISNGKISISGTVSYASQKPWFFTGSIRENIMMGKAYNKERYDKVLSVCQLNYDLTQLPEGDLTKICASGTTLSGGQKVRINLARAVYHEADIYLLDDVLASVDAPCGLKIFQECIQDFLKHKIVLLVARTPNVLSQSHKILFVDEGKVKVVSGKNLIIDHGGLKSDPMAYEVLKSSLLGPQQINHSRGSERPKMKLNVLSTISTFLSSHGSYSFIFSVLSSLIILKYLEIRCDTGLYSWIDSNFPGQDSASAFVTLGLHSILVLCCTGSTFAIYYIFTLFSARTITGLHKTMINSILNAPAHFFDKPEQGSPLQILTEDMKSLDDDFSKTILGTLNSALELLSVFYLVSCVSPLIALSTVSILLAVHCSNGTTAESTEVHSDSQSALEGSPMLTFLENTAEGLLTIRASKGTEFMANKFEKILSNASVYGNEYMARRRWLLFKYDFVCWAYISLTCYALIYFAQSRESTANLEIVLMRIFALNYVLRWSLQAVTELETQATAIQRSMEICFIKPEEVKDVSISKVSHKCSKIEFRNVSVNYGSGHQVLKNVCLSVNSAESIGIIGRTGAGKSTLLAAALKMVPLVSGSILIDDVSIDGMSPIELRRRIGVISQDALIFSGTLRVNIDPMNEFLDQDLKTTLAQLGIENLLPCLDSVVEERGRNLSAGQKQLIALTRAHLRKSGIVFLDEPTAHVDRRTWTVLRRAFQNHLKSSTVISIAHNNNFIFRPKRILLLEEGRVVNARF